MIATINGSDIEVKQVWFADGDVYVLFSDGEVSRYDNKDVSVDTSLEGVYFVQAEQSLYTLFNIPVFCYTEGYPLDDEQIQFTDVKFFFPGLHKYDGSYVSLNDNWDISIWTKDGSEVVGESSWLDVAPEFKLALKAR